MTSIYFFPWALLFRSSTIVLTIVIIYVPTLLIDYSATLRTVVLCLQEPVLLTDLTIYFSMMIDIVFIRCPYFDTVQLSIAIGS